MSATAKAKRKKAPAGKTKKRAKPSSSGTAAKRAKRALRERVIEARDGEDFRCVKLRVRRGERVTLRGAVRVDHATVASGGVLRHSDQKGAAPRTLDNKGIVEVSGSAGK